MHQVQCAYKEAGLCVASGNRWSNLMPCEARNAGNATCANVVHLMCSIQHHKFDASSLKKPTLQVKQDCACPYAVPVLCIDCATDHALPSQDLSETSALSAVKIKASSTVFLSVTPGDGFCVGTALLKAIYPNILRIRDPDLPQNKLRLKRLNCELQAKMEDHLVSNQESFMDRATLEQEMTVTGFADLSTLVTSWKNAWGAGGCTFHMTASALLQRPVEIYEVCQDLLENEVHVYE